MNDERRFLTILIAAGVGLSVVLGSVVLLIELLILEALNG